jgi:hypothetical protein
MKATINIPDELYRQVKARSALEGRTVREVTTELYRRWLEEEPAGPISGSPDADGGDAAAAWLAGWEEMGRRIARNPKDPRSTREILLDDRR